MAILCQCYKTCFSCPYRVCKKARVFAPGKLYQPYQLQVNGTSFCKETLASSIRQGLNIQLVTQKRKLLNKFYNIDNLLLVNRQ